MMLCGGMGAFVYDIYLLSNIMVCKIYDFLLFLIVSYGYLAAQQQPSVTGGRSSQPPAYTASSSQWSSPTPQAPSWPSGSDPAAQVPPAAVTGQSAAAAGAEEQFSDVFHSQRKP